jgi:hypothetical protein
VYLESLLSAIHMVLTFQIANTTIWTQSQQEAVAK